MWTPLTTGPVHCGQRCADDIGQTVNCSNKSASARFTFSVSSDEEHVRMQLKLCGRTFDFGARAHNYLLLTLARRRLLDESEGVQARSCGWLDMAEFSHDPSFSPTRVNLSLYRFRRQAAALGVPAGVELLERRSGRKIRIATSALSIVQT